MVVSKDVDLFQPFMPEAAEHFSTVKQKAYSVNYLVDTIR